MHKIQARNILRAVSPSSTPLSLKIRVRLNELFFDSNQADINSWHADLRCVQHTEASVNGKRMVRIGKKKGSPEK